MALRLFKKVAKIANEGQGGAKENGLYDYLMTGLSVCLQKGLANAYIHGRVRIHGSGAETNYHNDYTYHRETIMDYYRMRDGAV